MGCQGCETMNNNREILVNFGLNINCAIGGTIFVPKDMYKHGSHPMENNEPN